MALPTTYSTGTTTVNANETAVTGQGTTWLTSGLQAGDLFWAGGMSVRIASIQSNTSLTLAFPWPGGNRAAQQYEVRFTPDATRVLAAARSLLDSLSNGVLYALGSLQTGANKLAYFTGAGAAALTDITAHARSILGLTGGAGKFLASTGASSSALRDIVGPVAQAGGIPTGSIIETGSNANGRYTKFADGTMICVAFGLILKPASDTTTGVKSAVWTFPAAFVSADLTISHTISSGQPNARASTTFSSQSASSATLLYQEGASIAADIRTYATATGKWF